MRATAMRARVIVMSFIGAGAMRRRDGEKREVGGVSKKKAPYASPTLTNHGDIVVITRALGAPGSDGISGSTPGMTQIDPP